MNGMRFNLINRKYDPLGARSRRSKVWRSYGSSAILCNYNESSAEYGKDTLLLVDRRGKEASLRYRGYADVEFVTE